MPERPLESLSQGSTAQRAFLYVRFCNVTLLDRSTKGSLLSIEHGKVIAVAEVPNWQGTEAEKHDLLNAFARNCDCLIVDGVYTTTCAGHALIKFQKGLDDLLFGRRIKQRLIDEEWSVDLSD